MADIQNPDRAYLEKVVELLSIILRAIERDVRDGATIAELKSMMAQRAKAIVAGNPTLKKQNPRYEPFPSPGVSMLFESTAGWPGDLASLLLQIPAELDKVQAYWNTGPASRDGFYGAKQTLPKITAAIADILGVKPADETGLDETDLAKLRAGCKCALPLANLAETREGTGAR